MMLWMIAMFSVGQHGLWQEQCHLWAYAAIMWVSFSVENVSLYVMRAGSDSSVSPVLGKVARTNEAAADEVCLARRVRDTYFDYGQTAERWDTAERKSW